MTDNRIAMCGICKSQGSVGSMWNGDGKEVFWGECLDCRQTSGQRENYTQALIEWNRQQKPDDMPDSPKPMPCPFCRGKAQTMPFGPSRANCTEKSKHGYLVVCNCGAKSAKKGTEREAIEWWNTRPESARTGVEELVEHCEFLLHQNRISRGKMMTKPYAKQVANDIARAKQQMKG